MYVYIYVHVYVYMHVHVYVFLFEYLHSRYLDDSPGRGLLMAAPVGLIALPGMNNSVANCRDKL